MGTVVFFVCVSVCHSSDFESGIIFRNFDDLSPLNAIKSGSCF